MALTAYPVPGKQKSAVICEAFIAGAPKSASGAVFYGITEGNVDHWRRVRASGEDYYFIDGSYFDSIRNRQYRVTRNHVQLPDARRHQSNGKRFHKLGLNISAPHFMEHGYWLVVEQSSVFMRLTAEDPQWLPKNIDLLRERKVVVRAWSNNKMKAQADLPTALAGAWMVVTHSSAAAVTAALAGVPSRVSQMSAIYGMCMDERHHFMNVLADNQFSISEMQEGLAWKQISRV